jgi:hypothetical protein
MTEGVQAAQAYRRGVVLGNFQHRLPFAGIVFVG